MPRSDQIYKIKTDKKCDLQAKAYREFGNDLFKKRDYANSLVNYNKSIVFAKTNEVLSLGYANRSAVYIEIKLFQDCLVNIELARKNGYPEDKMAKLMEREEKCKKLMLQQETVENPFDSVKLSYPANPKIPWIVESLQLLKTPKYGRGIYATKDFKVGDIISIEEPPISAPCDIGYNMFCANCLKPCNLNLIPCKRSASMMFCSTDCMEASHAKDFEINKNINFLTELADLFGGKSKLDKFLKSPDLKKLQCSIFDFDWSNKEDPNYRENLGKCMLSLSHDVSNDILLAPCNDIFRHIYPKSIADFLIGLVETNNISFCFDGSTGAIYNYSMPLFSTLINHSCINNVYLMPIQNKIVTIATKPIKAGEQIFRSYLTKDIPEHLKPGLFSLHNFTCDCEQCKNPSSTIFNPPIPLLSEIITRNTISKGRQMLTELKDFANQENVSFEMIIYSQRMIEEILLILSIFSMLPC